MRSRVCKSVTVRVELQVSQSRPHRFACRYRRLTAHMLSVTFFFFFSSRRRHTRFDCDWSSDVVLFRSVTEGIDVVRALWRDTPATFQGRFSRFAGVSIDPKPMQVLPPIWVGGRSDAALTRAGRQGDGWVSYVIQPERYARSLEKIRAAAHAAGRSLAGFTAAHLVFITAGRDYERAKQAWVSVLSRRYAQDFEPLAKKYGVIGTPAECEIGRAHV